MKNIANHSFSDWTICKTIKKIGRSMHFPVHRILMHVCPNVFDLIVFLKDDQKNVREKETISFEKEEKKGKDHILDMLTRVLNVHGFLIARLWMLPPLQCSTVNLCFLHY